MFFLRKLPDGTIVLNKQGQQLLNKYYPPPKQHGKKNLQQWLDLKKSKDTLKVG